MPNFRTYTPIRTCTREFTTYRSYKKYLVVDFFKRCGYCDGSDTWSGGYRAFHIDHFAPKDKFPDLELLYDNLIYSCPSCNNSKSNKWPSNDPTQNIVGNDGFLNPVTDDLNAHFTRDDNGNIIGLGNVAKYMIVSLNLNLERHSVIWMLTQLEELISIYENILITKALSKKVKNATENIHYRLLKIFFEHYTKLKGLNA